MTISLIERTILEAALIRIPRDELLADCRAQGHQTQEIMNTLVTLSRDNLIDLSHGEGREHRTRRDRPYYCTTTRGRQVLVVNHPPLFH
jgi:hypothetical protein